MPNKYAYYSAPGVKLEGDKKMVINDVEYHLNDPINYWDWYLLTPAEKNLFVDETYVTIADCKYSSSDANVIPAGTVMLPDEYNTLKAAHTEVYHVEKQENVPFDFVYRSTNNMSHDTGYMLTYRVNNPTDWNTWYTKAQGAPTDKKQKDESMAGYEDGPTYYFTGGEAGVLGQREYQVSNLISKNIYDTYQAMIAGHPGAVPAGQATFEKAYIVTNEYTSGDVHLNVGSTVPENKKDNMEGYVAPAYICTSTIQLSKTEFIYVGARMTAEQKEAYKTANPTLADIIDTDVVPAYYWARTIVDLRYGALCRRQTVPTSPSTTMPSTCSSILAIVRILKVPASYILRDRSISMTLKLAIWQEQRAILLITHCRDQLTTPLLITAQAPLIMEVVP